MRRSAPALLCAAVLALGCFGTWSYVQNYLVYRGFPPPADPPGVVSGTLRSVGFYNRALGRRDSYLIYLPPGYSPAARRGVRFPVLYLLHGTGSDAWHFINVGQVGVDVDKLLSVHKIHPMLVVMPQAQNGTLNDDTEWANTAQGRYEAAVLDVVRRVDRSWPTIRRRAGRAIAGLSMGGYGAINIALHHLQTFGTAESWSGYFTQSRSGPFSGASAATLRANSPTAYAPTVATDPGGLHLHVLLYSGLGDPHSSGQRAFTDELRRLGASVRAARFPGAHSWSLWRGEMPLALRFANRSLTHVSSPGPSLGLHRGR